MSTKKLLFLISIFCLFIACKGKPPYKPDYEIALGRIIGQENCKNAKSQNAWLIQFSGPNVGGKSYGEEISYNGTTYKNIVKTYGLPDSQQTVGKKYSFEFYLLDPSLANNCEVTNATVYKITEIKVRKIVDSFDQ